MTRTFPTIVDIASAYRFALEAEMAGADFSAAAEVIAPDEPWREKLEELTCAHDDRVQKLRAKADAPNAASEARWHGFHDAPLARVLEAEPATSWPAAAEQMAAVEDAIADHHEALVTHAGDVLGDRAGPFVKAAQQAREAAEELRRMM